MPIRYVHTRELTPWIDKLLTYILDPLYNDESEPYSKSYIARGTELPSGQLAQNKTKRRKCITTHKRHKS